MNVLERRFQLAAHDTTAAREAFAGLTTFLTMGYIVFVQPANAEANGTVVIAERMIKWFFLNGHDGRGAAIAIILFVAVIPVMIWNVRRFREQEEER